MSMALTEAERQDVYRRAMTEPSSVTAAIDLTLAALAEKAKPKECHPDDADILISAMASAFMRYRLPDDFAPDGGIVFTPDYNVGTDWQGRHRPVGTNLLSYPQTFNMMHEIAIAAGLVVRTGEAK